MKKILIALAIAGLGLCVRAAESPVSIDPQHSRIEFDVKATMHGFTGKVEAYKTDIIADPASGLVTKAQVQVKFADLKTGDTKRDREMLEWEQVDQFPEVLYTMTKLDSLGGGKYTAHGQLILHGVTKEIAFPVTIATADKTTYSIDGETNLDTHDYNLPTIRKFGMLKVNPVVRVFFHLQGSAAVK
ncbi:hypothetical protein DB347_03485 [Opitutaceae bacterium EW11]|nr:hypothetical protein DB347_03485 [Opitutaceae bacterium EW11]